MAFALPRCRFPRAALGFAPQLVPRCQVQAVTFALPRAPATRITSHISARMAHSCTHVVIDPSRMIEEETVSGYKAEHYYPVRIGEVFQDRYRVICKTGYGSASTVWLCRDLRNDGKCVALKVYINRSKVHRELPIYIHINGIKSDHDGQKNLRKFLASFEVNGPNGKHICLVHQALSMTLEDFRCYSPNREISAAVIRETFGNILRALHFLRKEAHVIHTGLL
jgi:serine/threonine-protein kinase SRPK3